MYLFNEGVISRLNALCKNEDITFIGLGKYDFQFSFGQVGHFQSELKVSFVIKNKKYVWEHGATDAPVWNLIGQIPEAFSLNSPEFITMHLKSGDSVSFYTEESPYECCNVTYSTQEGNVREVF